MSNLRKAFLVGQAIIVCCAVMPARAHAQWWSSTSAAPRDYEECAERVKNAAGANDKDKDSLSECDAKFAGRRKPGGGYTYFDFMQNRSFDIAGPNPTPDESRKIDEQYTAYLAEQRRDIIAAAFLRRQQAPPKPVTEFAKQPAKLTIDTRPKASSVRRQKIETCDGRLSCTWQDISGTWQDLTGKMQSIRKNLFGS